jgi:heptosyltransferase-1
MDSSLPPPADSERSPRILIVRLSAHGDVIHALPLLSAIKTQAPNAHVGWLVESSAASLLENHPLIDQLHIARRKEWLKQLRNPFCWGSVLSDALALLRELREAKYTVSLDVQGLLKSALWPFLARIPKRYGFKATREQADVFYTDKLPPMNICDASRFAVERYLDLARAIGCVVTVPEFHVPPVSEQIQQHMDSLLGESDRLLVVLAPFTRWASKHWEISYWPELMTALLQLNVRLVILGAPGDQAATEAMLAALPVSVKSGSVLNLVGKTDWPDLYALFKRTQLLIGLDSAPLHVANAVGVPHIIGLYGPTAPGRTGPIGERHATLSTALSCQPCFEHHCPIGTHDCMKQLQPEIVLAMARRMLLESGAGLLSEDSTPGKVSS